MKSLFSIYTQLCLQNIENDGYSPVEKLTYSDLFYIGVSDKKTPMFLIDCNIDNFPNDLELKYIQVLYNKRCRIIDNNKKTEVTCTILQLNDESYDFQNYFLEVIDLILRRLPKNPTSLQINEEIETMIKLFSCTTHPALKTVQGLWAEMLVIEQSKCPEYLIKAWHAKSTSKFDFNDGESKIEVKSSSNSIRIHTFEYGQLTSNNTSKLLIASVFAIETGLGKNILDLRESIFSRVSDLNVQFLLDKKIFETLGVDINNCSDFNFDYQLAVDELKFYDSVNIPNIKKEYIPSEISNIKFNCDISNCISLKRNELLSCSEKMIQML